MTEFVKKHPFITINISGILLLLLCCLFSEIFDPVVWMIFIVLVYYRWFIIICGVILSIAAFISVKCKNGTAAVLTSAFGGFVGGFLGVNLFSADEKTERSVKVIFNIYAWVIVILLCGYFGVPVLN